MAGGRPPKYTTVEQLEKLIEHYFANEAFIGEGDNRQFVPTMAGLAYALDLSRQGLLEYSNKDQFSDAIKDARLRIEISLEQRLAGNAVTGTIFNLKNNFAWKDKTETEHSGVVGISDLTDEQLDSRLNAIVESQTKD